MAKKVAPRSLQMALFFFFILIGLTVLLIAFIVGRQREKITYQARAVDSGCSQQTPICRPNRPQDVINTNGCDGSSGRCMWNYTRTTLNCTDRANCRPGNVNQDGLYNAYGCSVPNGGAVIYSSECYRVDDWVNTNCCAAAGGPTNTPPPAATNTPPTAATNTPAPVPTNTPPAIPTPTSPAAPTPTLPATATPTPPTDGGPGPTDPLDTSYCDACGYCYSAPERVPSDWGKCVACLYPGLSGSTPQSQATLKGHPTPYPDHYYTMIGCLSTVPGEFTEQMTTAAFSLIGGIAFLALLYGAFVVATSKGDRQRLSYGKRIVYGAIAGLLFVLFSTFLVRFVAGKILKIPGFE